MGLDLGDLGADPIAAFGRWLDEAVRSSGRPNPTAMTLCTLGPDGWPQGRVVLLKSFDARGLRFFTNKHSEKGRALAAHPRAEAVFHWDSLGRQLRVRGDVEDLGSDEALAYFRSRPRGSQLAAWASDQSEAVASREAMDARLAAVEERFKGQDAGLPPNWGGYCLRPWRIEFWQEGAFRFHDRIVFEKSAGGWEARRLFP
ncbi:MAG TPA: pyridoxamine 5'-phosphate oxidase [bacterium]|nr:pyridoxamine 5'-phosphate oxidase [bacterium]